MDFDQVTVNGVNSNSICAKSVQIATKTSTIQPYNVIMIQPFKALKRESKERSKKYENRSMYETGAGQFQSRY